ncbi:MAG: hypothetical protein AAFX06_06405 [Planctomycetota bacterium]
MNTKVLLTVTMSVFTVFPAMAEDSKTKSLSELDRLQIAVQRICPVSGERLGAMGDPIKVKVGDQIAFLCCEACQNSKIDGKHWRDIEARLVQAQGKCPIMGKPVDGEMESTVVKGRKLYVCCPPCIDKIKADPATSLQKLTKSYAAFLQEEQRVEGDRLHAQAQGICPVSGKPLGTMGEPVKVKVGAKEHAFLCSKDCVGKKLSAERWKIVQTNLAKAQRICPVMYNPIDASMESTVVNGRKIFVCCPPCIEKIEAEPARYIAQLNEQIANAKKSGTE